VSHGSAIPTHSKCYIGAISMTIYRKIYEQNFGPIPKEPNGRTYEIHHIDGNHSNNEPSNLKAVTIQEHYNIHYAQGDWGACFKIAKRMEMPPSVKSELARLAANKRLMEGIHNFQDKAFHQKYSSINQQNRVLSGKHNFLGSGLQKSRVDNGTHHFLGSGLQKSRVDNGTHPFLKQNRTKYSCGITSEKAKKIQQDLIENGTHTGTKQFAQIHTCPHCDKEGKGLIMFRFHFDNCKFLK